MISEAGKNFSQEPYFKKKKNTKGSNSEISRALC